MLSAAPILLLSAVFAGQLHRCAAFRCPPRYLHCSTVVYCLMLSTAVFGVASPVLLLPAASAGQLDREADLIFIALVSKSQDDRWVANTTLEQQNESKTQPILST